MKYLSRPDLQLVLIALFCLAAGVAASHYTVDIHLLDTYYILGLFTIAVIFAALVMIEAGIYTLTSKLRQWRWLHILHIVSILWIIISFVLYCYFGGSRNMEPGAPRRYYDFAGYSLFQIASPLMTFTLLLFLAGQIGFIVNVVAGFSRGRKNRFK